MNIAERGEYWARWRPDVTAVKLEGREIPWGQWGERVPRLAGALAQRGIAPWDRVGILGANSVEWCELALAALHAGAIVVPVNIRLAPPEIAHVIEDAGLSALAFDGAFAEAYAAAAQTRAVATTIGLDGAAGAAVTHAELAEGPPMPSSVARDDGDAAVIGYTSGTTGFPKGATLTHGNLAAVGYQTALAEGSTHERRTYMPVPLAFTGGIVNNFLATYAVGGTLVVDKAFAPDAALRALVEERITTMYAVPIMWQAIAGAEGFADADLSALSTAITGGAPVSRALLEAYHAKGVTIRQAYGLTEATGSVCFLPGSQALEKLSAAGLPNADTRLRLIDADGADVTEAGVVGEILVQGPQVMAGYWNAPEATAEALRDGWLHTGDMGRFDEDGCLEVVDRLKAMFISGGLNVYPAEIERVVDGLPGVAECAALGIEHERFGEACAIVVVPADGGFDEEALLARCREQLADYKVPRTVIVAGEPLPRGMSGKILRSEVQAKYGTP